MDQLLQHTLLADGVLAGVALAPFDPPLFCSAQYRALERLESGRAGPLGSTFDAELGWAPRPGTGGGLTAYDKHGARRPGDPPPPRDPGARRVVVVGCSFTRGDEVAGHETWPAQLDELRPDLAVENYGMGAYGLGQVLLRLRRDGLPREPAEVWLAWVPSTTPRATTHFLPLQNPWTEVLLFKPRFLLDGAGELTLAPNPAREHGDTLRLLSDQRALIAAIGGTDERLARAPVAFAPRGSSWTHHSALARVGLTWHSRAGERGARRIADPDDDLRRLALALVQACAREAREAGARFRLVVLPSRRDLQSIGSEAPYWSALTSAAEGAGVQVLELTDALTAAGAPDDDGAWCAGGHYAPRTNALVAARLARWTREPPR